MKNNIKEILKKKGITQKELAAMIGMSEVGISKAINGSATHVTLDKIAKALNVSKEDLYDPNILLARYGSDKTPLKLGELEIPCYVLENGMRVFSGRGIQKALGYESKSGQWMKSFCNIRRKCIFVWNFGEVAMTDDGKQLLSTFETRLRHLLYLHEEQGRENAELRRQLEDTEEARKQLQADYEELTRRYNDLKTATAISLDGNDVRETKARLSRLVREVDKCIALLNE